MGGQPGHVSENGSHHQCEPSGLGASHMGGARAQQVWSTQETRQNINWLGLWVIHLMLIEFQNQLQGLHVMIRMDNMTPKLISIGSGGHAQGLLRREASLLFGWLEQHWASIKAEHPAGTVNLGEDWLSHQQVSKA